MSWWRRLLSSRRLERELDAELRYHLERQIEDNVRAGLTEDEARRRARDQFGGVEQIKEACRDVRGTRWFDETFRDLGLACRVLARDRSFTIAAAVTLALGIGLNGASFSVVEAVLISPLPVRNPEALVWISEQNEELETISGAHLDSWRESAQSFEVLSPLLAGDADLEENLSGVRFACVSADLARLFGVTPLLGRDFAPQDFHDAPGAPGLRATKMGPAAGVAVLSHQLFRRLGGSDDVLGRSLTIRGVSYTVVGVLPMSLRLPVPPSLQLGVGPDSDVDLFLSTRIDRSYRGPGAVLGRLATGSSLSAATAELETLALHAGPPTSSEPPPQLRLIPLQERVVGGVKRTILILWACVGLVLLIACANVSGMQIARLLARRHEISVRLALGASRWRLARQLIAENAVLGLGAGVAGLALARVCVVLVARTGPVDVPRLRDAALTPGALPACAGSSLVTVLALSVVPALLSRGASTVLPPGGAVTSSFRSARRWQGALVVAELALTLTLLAGGGLMLRSLLLVQAEGADLAPEQVLSARVRAADPRAQVPPRDRLRRNGLLLDELESLPGVRHAALWTVTFGLPARVEGLPGPPKAPVAMWFNVSPGFREASGVRLVAGRWFEASDRGARPPVVVVSERFARRVADGSDARSLVGRRTPGPFPTGRTDEREGLLRIIGVVSDYRSGQLGILQPDDPLAAPQVFYLDALRPILGGELLVRMATPPESQLAPVRRTVAGSDGLRLIGADRLIDQLSRALEPRRFYTLAFTWFGAVALLVAAVGVTGVLTLSVAQRSAEIAVRMALGARQSDIRKMVMSQAGALLITGLGGGLMGAALLSRPIEAVLYGVQANDPIVYLVACAVLALAPLCAAYLPARQAMRTSPWETLRRE